MRQEQNKKLQAMRHRDVLCSGPSPGSVVVVCIGKRNSSTITESKVCTASAVVERCSRLPVVKKRKQFATKAIAIMEYTDMLFCNCLGRVESTHYSPARSPLRYAADAEFNIQTFINLTCALSLAHTIVNH